MIVGVIQPAHGIGGRADLPLPGELVLQAGGFVVLASFLAVGLAWRGPRFTPLAPGAEPAGARARWGRVARWVALAVLGYLVITAFAGPADPDHNPAPRALYVLAWVGLVPASLALGPVWRAVNPLRALHRAVCAVLRQPVSGRRRPPRWLGYWPAALGLAVFVWLELVPEQRADPAVVGGFLLGYAVFSTAAATVFGERWFDRGDPFEVYSTLIGALCPLIWLAGSAPSRPDEAPRHPAGPPRPRLVNPLRRLAAIPPTPGLVAVLAVWWGSTVFDGVSGTPWWATASQQVASGLSIPRSALATAVLLALIAAVATGYGVTTGGRAAELVSTLIPIAVGYTIAHYASLLIVEGPRGLTQLLDPGAAGEPALGAAPAPGLIATIQVAAVLTGHVLGVIAAHDRVLGCRADAPAAAPGAEWPNSTGPRSTEPARPGAPESLARPPATVPATDPDVVGGDRRAPSPVERAGSAERAPVATAPTNSGLADPRRLAEQIPLVLLMIAYTMSGLYLLVIA